MTTGFASGGGFLGMAAPEREFGAGNMLGIGLMCLYCSHNVATMPRKDALLRVRMSEKLLNRLRRFAEKQGLDMSEVVRAWVATLPEEDDLGPN